MIRSLEVLFTPAEFAGLPKRDLTKTVCVVFDVLRATSTMVTALGNGAASIIPVAEIAEAIAVRKEHPQVLLAGERDGLRIRKQQTGGVDFDLGNSPREFMKEKVQGKAIVMTTTNGTRALRACAGAKTVAIGSFLNLRAVSDWIGREQPEHLLIVCGGTGEGAAYEDTLAAGALCDLIWPEKPEAGFTDSAFMARDIYQASDGVLFRAMQYAQNVRRLLKIPELRDDVPLCLQRDTIGIVPVLHKDGSLRKV